MMHKRKIMQTWRQFLFTVLMLAFALSSCVPVYRTNTLFMPAFEEKGDFVAEASLGTGDLSVNAGYAASQNLALFAGYQNRSLDDGTSGNHFFELGLGWFSGQSQSISSEILGSFGYGQFSYYRRYSPLFSDSYREQFINTDYLRSTLQYNLHFHVNPLTFSLGSRFVYAHFNDFEDSTMREYDSSTLSYITASNFTRTYLEPMGTLTLNVKQISVFAQSGFVFLLHGDTSIFSHDVFTMNFGIRYRMNHLNR
ncbi:MAG: hypothetical protein ACK4VN_01430 [Bacteroidales bacterium]